MDQRCASDEKPCSSEDQWCSCGEQRCAFEEELRAWRGRSIVRGGAPIPYRGTSTTSAPAQATCVAVLAAQSAI